jgi:hypothetical protein
MKKRFISSYASKIPEEIASRRSFEDWRATVEAKIRVIYM